MLLVLLIAFSVVTAAGIYAAGAAFALTLHLLGRLLGGSPSATLRWGGAALLILLFALVLRPDLLVLNPTAAPLAGAPASRIIAFWSAFACNWSALALLVLTGLVASARTPRPARAPRSIRGLPAELAQIRY